MTTIQKLPPITIPFRDIERLVAFARDAYLRGDRYVGFLLSELQRSEIGQIGDFHEYVVSINRRVIYRLDDEVELRSHFLVHPLDAPRPGEDISVATALGVALLGLAIDDRMSFQDEDWGGCHEVVVVGLGGFLKAREEVSVLTFS